MARSQRMADLFDQPPGQWGLRGDPFLWEEMAQALAETDLPHSPAELIVLLESTFAQLVGEPLDPSKHSVFVERYSHGGMSSGCVSPAFWHESGFPLLQARCVAA